MDGVAFDDAVTGRGRLGDDGGRGEGCGGGGCWRCSRCSRCGDGGARGRGGGVCGCGCGLSGDAEFFGADNVQAGGGSAGGGRGEGEAGKRGHDEGFRRLCLFGIADEEADARTVDSGCVGVRGLSDDDAGISGCGDVGDGTELEPEAADVDGGGALALTEEVGDGDLLCAEAFSDADGPFAAYGCAGCGRLGEDASGRYVGGVEAIFEVEAETEGAGLFACFGDGEAGQVGDFDLAAVDGEAHGDERRGERDHKHGQGSKNDVEEAVDSADRQLHRLKQDTGDGEIADAVTWPVSLTFIW